MDSEKKVRVVSFFTLFGVATTAIVYNDILYIANKPLLAAIELMRALIVLPIAMAILAYFNEKRRERFDFWAKLCLIAVYFFDILVALTRPSDVVGGFFFSIGLLLLGYFLPLKSIKFRNYVSIGYSAILAILLFIVKTSHIPTELIIIAMLAGINAIGIALPLNMTLLQKTTPVAPLHENTLEIQENRDSPSTTPNPSADKAEAGTDYLHQLETKIDALPLSKREKEIALHILEGESRSEIAAELNLSEETVKKHTANIYAKLQISSHSELFKAVLG